MPVYWGESYWGEFYWEGSLYIPPSPTPGYLLQAENRFPNPSAEINVAGWSFSGVTLAQISSDAWVGNDSVQGTITSTSTPYVSPSIVGATDATNVLVTPGESLSVGIRAKSSRATGAVRWQVAFFTSSGVQIGSNVLGDYMALNSTTWTTVKIEGVDVPGDASYANCILLVVTTGAPTGMANHLTADVLKLDGAHASPTSKLPSYVDGDQGPDYSWKGVAHSSYSVRREIKLAAVAFSGGSVKIVPKIYRATKQNQLVEDVTGLFIDGAIDVDVDRTIKRTASFTFDQFGRVTPFKDYLAVFEELQYENGDVETSQIGLFTVELPSEAFRENSYRAQFPAFEVTQILEEAAFRDTYNVAGAVRYVDAIRVLIESEGLLHNIPDDARVTPTGGLTFPPGVTKLAAINQMAQTISMYNHFTTPDGRVTTTPYRTLATAQPYTVYTLGQDSKIVGDIQFDPSDEAIKNVIVVVRDDPSKPSLRAERINNSTNSPTSIINLGRERTRVVFDGSLADQTAVDALANRLVEEVGVSRECTLSVFPDPLLTPHQVATLDLSSRPDDLDKYSGRYWMKGYSHGLQPATAWMGLKLRRVDDLL